LSGRDLAAFQFTAARDIFASLDDQTARGFMIGAGTGSGKTLAFYLPAFLAIVPTLTRPASAVHTLALYPRKELLRDQAREAYVVARRMDAVLDGARARRLRIGLLYADTPYDAKDHRQFGGSNSAWR